MPHLRHRFFMKFRGRNAHPNRVEKPHPRGLVGRTPWPHSRHNDISTLRSASRPTGASAADQGVRPTNPGGPVFHGISRAEGPFKQARRPVLLGSVALLVLFAAAAGTGIVAAGLLAGDDGGGGSGAIAADEL